MNFIIGDTVVDNIGQRFVLYPHPNTVSFIGVSTLDDGIVVAMNHSGYYLNAPTAYDQKPDFTKIDRFMEARKAWATLGSTVRSHLIVTAKTKKVTAIVLLRALLPDLSLTEAKYLVEQE